MKSLAFQNILFVILQPGIVAGVVPYFLVRHKIVSLLNAPFQTFQHIAFLILLIGLIIVLHCVFRFFKDGRGTLSPAVPTKQLVINGLYKYSRNPMYIGVMLILIGETIFCNSLHLLLYSVFVFIAFNLFVIFREEPRLKKDFGEQYDNYKQRVKRWI
ncbi:isoprenylcysteine carboxylmethyltransferase family protein [Pedobacter nyackensis]|uniref:methyltransferase family protein n=1 Tax=Pedobacter nyackensis TaxID=475255 RepID=UPI002931228B|nr:isoprenylcysteine carboxylmethyltransferase family protein [Pedobacter nyackensis]